LEKEEIMSDLKDKFTVTRKAEFYSDFTVNLDRNPVTGFLARTTNENSVKQAIRNLVMTTRTERFYRSDVGSRIKSLLFEPMDIRTVEMLKTTIKETIINNEPRANTLDVVVETSDDLNGYFVTIYFEIVNMPKEQFEVSLMLTRVR
jgi:phage baseplate assembly protein W